MSFAGELVELGAAHDECRFGGKASSLARCLQASLPVPPGFALSPALALAIAEGNADARELLVASAALLAGPVAVRSSAIGEDGARASFAGIHRSVLGPASLAEAVGAVVGSAHGAAAAAYRERLGLAEPPRMAVLVQRLIPADVAGVLFSKPDGELVIEAVIGLGELVVSGEITPEHLVLGTDGAIRSRRPSDQDIQLRLAGPHTTQTTLSPPAQIIDAGHARALSDLVRALNRVFQGPHDVEFAFTGRELWLLQRRPVTA